MDYRPFGVPRPVDVASDHSDRLCDVLGRVTGTADLHGNGLALPLDLDRVEWTECGDDRRARSHDDPRHARLGSRGMRCSTAWGSFT